MKAKTKTRKAPEQKSVKLKDLRSKRDPMGGNKIFEKGGTKNFN